MLVVSRIKDGRTAKECVRRTGHQWTGGGGVRGGNYRELGSNTRRERKKGEKRGVKNGKSQGQRHQ